MYFSTLVIFVNKIVIFQLLFKHYWSLKGQMIVPFHLKEKKGNKILFYKNCDQQNQYVPIF